MDEITSDTTIAMRVAVGAGIALAVFVIVPTTLILAVQPSWMGFQRQTMKQSHQYVEAAETMLLQWVDKYAELETDALKYEAGGHDAIARGLRTQQRALLARIRTSSERIPTDALPQSVSQFLAAHPRNP